jgi:EspG family
LAPELRAVPYGEPRTQDWVTQHPGLQVLVKQGICDEAGVVQAHIAERMAVLAAPDVEVVVLVSRGPLSWSVRPDIVARMAASGELDAEVSSRGPLSQSPRVDLEDHATWRTVPDDQLRIVLARRAGRWVSAARAGANVTIDDCAEWGQERLGGLACDALNFVHKTEPASFSPINVPLDELMATVAARLQLGDALTRDTPLRALGLRGSALTAVAAALDEPAAEAVLYARAYVDGAAAMSESVLNVRDTASARLVTYRLASPLGSRQSWLCIGPATPAQIAHGVATVLGSVPVESWDRHERLA